jgi:hypothetical protein
MTELPELLECDRCRAAWDELDKTDPDDDLELRELTLVDWHDAGHYDMPVPEG